jgi:hypothetical protein
MKGNLLRFLSYNKEKIENLIACLKSGGNYHNGEVALMFHDKIIRFPEDESTIFNLEDGRGNRTSRRKAIECLQEFLVIARLYKESSLGGA